MLKERLPIVQRWKTLKGLVSFKESKVGVFSDSLKGIYITLLHQKRVGTFPTIVIRTSNLNNVSFIFTYLFIHLI